MFKERYAQPVGTKGSLKWIQRFAGDPAHLTDAVRAAGDLGADWTAEWVSPLEVDDWAEYRDAGFLQRVGRADLVGDLSQFWPVGGPQWDGLGRTNTGGIVLLEAKAHLSELASSCGAGGNSLRVIREALNATKARYRIPLEYDWLSGFYQYANRLAHLGFLQERGVEAIMAFIYFYGDEESGGPSSVEEWKDGLVPIYEHLGLRPHTIEGVVDVFVPVAILDEQDRARAITNRPPAPRPSAAAE